MAKLKMNDEPRRAYFPDMDRSPDRIAPNLRETLRQLVNGLAPWPLFLHGPAGIGKTCAALCVVDRCYRKNYFVRVSDGTVTDLDRTDRSEPIRYVMDQASAVYRTSQEICDAIMGEFGKKSKRSTESTWDQWSSARLAVLDELGSREKVGDAVFNITKELIDKRTGRPLIVISNLDLNAIGLLYDDRITSRLAAGTVVKLEGQDRRLSP